MDAEAPEPAGERAAFLAGLASLDTTCVRTASDDRTVTLDCVGADDAVVHEVALSVTPDGDLLSVTDDMTSRIFPNPYGNGSGDMTPWAPSADVVADAFSAATGTDVDGADLFSMTKPVGFPQESTVGRWHLYGVIWERDAGDSQSLRFAPRISATRDDAGLDEHPHLTGTAPYTLDRDTLEAWGEEQGLEVSTVSPRYAAVFDGSDFSVSTYLPTWSFTEIRWDRDLGAWPAAAGDAGFLPEGSREEIVTWVEAQDGPAAATVIDGIPVRLLTPESGNGNPPQGPYTTVTLGWRADDRG